MSLLFLFSCSAVPKEKEEWALIGLWRGKECDQLFPQTGECVGYVDGIPDLAMCERVAHKFTRVKGYDPMKEVHFCAKFIDHPHNTKRWHSLP